MYTQVNAIMDIYIFFTVNAKRKCGIPLSRDVHFRVTHTLCARIQAKTVLDLHVPYFIDHIYACEYMSVTNVLVYRVNVWYQLDSLERSLGYVTHLSH